MEAAMVPHPDITDLARTAVHHVAQQALQTPLPPDIPIRDARLRRQMAWERWRTRGAWLWGRGVETAVTHIVVLSSFILGLLTAMFILITSGALVAWLLRPTFAAGLWEGRHLLFMAQTWRLYGGLVGASIWLFCLLYLLLGLPLAGIVRAKRWAYGRFATRRRQRDWNEGAYSVDYDRFVAWWAARDRPWSYSPRPDWEQAHQWRLASHLSKTATAFSIMVLLVIYVKVLIAAFSYVLPAHPEKMFFTMLFTLWFTAPIVLMYLSVVLAQFFRWPSPTIVSFSAEAMSAFLRNLQTGNSFPAAFCGAIRSAWHKLMRPENP
jgi:hypothetical protein